MNHPTNAAPKTRKLTFLAAFCLVGVAAVLGVSRLRGAEESAKPAGDAGATRFFELRTYTTFDGRLDALHARFRDHTNALFTRHGMQMIGYWTPADEPRSKNTLIYILAYPDRAAREKAWKAFESDPDWQKAKADSEKDGKIVQHVESVFMNPTDFSPLK